MPRLRFVYIRAAAIKQMKLTAEVTALPHSSMFTIRTLTAQRQAVCAGFE